jgi:hypothetical protein
LGGFERCKNLDNSTLAATTIQAENSENSGRTRYKFYEYGE